MALELIAATNIEAALECIWPQKSERCAPMRINLDHPHIFASNINVTVNFFQTMFGATIVWDEDAAGVRGVRLSLGRAFVHVYDQPPKGHSGVVHHLGIETDNLDALVERMKWRGFQFREQIRNEPKFRYVMISGPDDLLIELFETNEPERWKIATVGRDGRFISFQEARSRE